MKSKYFFNPQILKNDPIEWGTHKKDYVHVSINEGQVSPGESCQFPKAWSVATQFKFSMYDYLLNHEVLAMKEVYGQV